MPAQDNSIALIAGIIAVALLVVVVALRSATAGKVQITLNDTIIAAIGAVLALLVSGKLAKMVISPTGITVERAIISSAAQPIAAQVTPLPVAPVTQEVKGAVTAIPDMVRRRVQGLDFILGSGGYDPDVISTYLEGLTQYDFFRYVIFLTPDRRLFGMIDARALFAVLKDQESQVKFKDFAGLVNSGGDLARNALTRLPGFVPASDAVKHQSDKHSVLEQMEKLRRDWLPVVNEEGQLDGIVERSRLIASMILDVTNQLQATQPQSALQR
jgi:hypothetical protein